MKYVIFKKGPLVEPVLFCDHTSHSAIKLDGAEAISAGFIVFTEKLHLPHCYGKSDSLKLESRGEEDEDIIRKWQNNSGMTFFMDFSDI